MLCTRNIDHQILFQTAPCTDGVKLLQYSGSLNSTSGGVVQLCVNQTRYLVCDDGWDFLSARILCQTLGYSPYGIIAYSEHSNFAPHCAFCVSTGAVALFNQALTSSAYNSIPLLRNITCDGTESSFSECTYEQSITAYCNYNFIGVYCQGPMPHYWYNCICC